MMKKETSENVEALYERLKMSAYLGCEYFKTESAGNSSCYDLSKKVEDILIWY